MVATPQLPGLTPLQSEIGAEERGGERGGEGERRIVGAGEECIAHPSRMGEIYTFWSCSHYSCT